MLYQKKSGRAARLKYLLTLPLAGGLLCASTLAFTTKNYGVIDLAPKLNLAAHATPVPAAINDKPLSATGQPQTDLANEHADNNQAVDTTKKIMAIGSGKNVLYVVDGKVYHNPLKGSQAELDKANKDFLKSISPNDIQSITVLKDKESTSQYGPEGANGVIIITTKKSALKDTTKKSDTLSDYERGRRDAERDMKTTPLVIINGKRTMVMPPPNFDWKQVDKAAYARLLHIDPNEIKTVSILPPDLAIKMYGKSMPAANGVVIISSTYTEAQFPAPKITPAFGNGNNDPVFTAVEIQPNFPGGEAGFGDFLRQNIKYPKEAKDNNVQGRVFIQFVVEKDGSLSDLKVLRDPGTGLGDEALRVLSLSPKWKPGVQNGRAVRVQYTVPINFSLADKSTSSVTKAAADSIYTRIDVHPNFPGGEEGFGKFLRDNIIYPSEAKLKGIQGRVFVQFIVEKDGRLSNLTILRNPGGGLGEEAVRVLGRSPNWTPGIQNGKAVRVKYTVPVSFSLAK